MLNTTYFPTTIVDGFFDNPDKIRQFALEQEFHRDETGRWPGIRSSQLFKLSPIIFNNICQKMLSLFFTAEQTYSYDIASYFQIVNGEFNSGWVHKDPSIITAMLYLTPDSFSGTSLYLNKNISYDDTTFVEDKIESYKLGTDSAKAKKSRELHNQNFEEMLNVKGIYNRLLIFDSNIYHAAHDFFGDSNEDSRLTLVSFVHGLKGEYCTPLQRSRNFIGQTTL